LSLPPLCFSLYARFFSFLSSFNFFFFSFLPSVPLCGKLTIRIFSSFFLKNRCGVFPPSLRFIFFLKRIVEGLAISSFFSPPVEVKGLFFSAIPFFSFFSRVDFFPSPVLRSFPTGWRVFFPIKLGAFFFFGLSPPRCLFSPPPETIGVFALFPLSPRFVPLAPQKSEGACRFSLLGARGEETCFFRYLPSPFFFFFFSFLRRARFPPFPPHFVFFLF